MTTVGTGKMVGAQVKRVEDPRVLLGQSQYVDDIHLPGTLGVAFVRSPYPHARVLTIDVSAAQAYPGVEAILTGADVAQAIRPLRVEYDPAKAPKHKPCNWSVLAQDKVRFVGEPVAVVVASDRYTAEDAAARVTVEYEPLEVVRDIEQAMEPDAPLIHEEWGDNLMQTVDMEAGAIAQAFQSADCIVAERFATGRHVALPMEARGCLAHYEPALGSLTLWSSTQVPHLIRAHLARLLDFPEHHIRVIAPDVGGGFGPKAYVYPEEVLLTFLAKHTGRPVKWIEDRRENLSASTLQAKQQVVQAELALTKEGTILGVRGRFICDVGAYSAYPWGSALEAGMAASAFPGGPYKVPAFRCEALSVVTNKTTSGAYRGVGLPVSILVMERLLDLGAQKLGLDPAELRLRNMIRKEEHPYQIITGVEIESGSHREALQKALDMLDYQAFRAEQQQARQRGRYLGVGLGCYVESSSYSYRSFEPVGITWGGYESATVRIDANGKVTVLVGTHSHGQGHETTFAQVAADELGVPVADVRVIQGDTTTVPHGWGTWASRSAVLGGGAIIQASSQLREKILRTASRLSEVPQDDLELAEGLVRRETDGLVLMPLQDIAHLLVVQAPAGLPEDEEPGLEATAHYTPPPWTHANATVLATVEVDIETGYVRLLRLIVVEDCGTIINPLVVDGQIQGGVAQGIGSALYEQTVYDDNGQLLTGTLMDYLAPTAVDVPQVEIGHIETPAPNTPRGIKGMGEGGAISPPAAIANAVADALAPLGVRVSEIPLTPERVLALIDRHGRERGDKGAREEKHMRLGLTLTGDQLTMADIVRFACQAEEARFDSVWVTEAWREAFVPLTAIAMQTNRVRIGTAIALTMARSPVLMELAATAVDEIAQGRLILGIGPGPRAWNENWHAVRFSPPAAYAREYAEVLRLMWTAHSGKSVDYQGKYLQIREYQRFSRPYRDRIPIYFGAVMPKFLRATGAVADGLCVAACNTPRYIADVARRYMAEGMQESQREAGTVGCMSLVICAVDRDREKARDRAKRQIAFYTTFPYYDIVLDQHDLAEEKTRIREAWTRNDTTGMVAGVSDQMVDLISIAGTPQECRQALSRYDGIVDEVSLYSPSFGLSREEVLTNHEAILEAFGR